MIRPKTRRFVEGVGRLPEALQLQKNGAQLAVRGECVGPERDSTSILPRRFGRPAERAQRIAQIHMRADMVGIGLDGTRQCLCGAGAIAALRERDAEKIERVGV